MDSTAPSRISITTSRYRHRAQIVWPRRELEVGVKEGLQEKDRRFIMGQDHRLFHHRREAQAATRVLTVNVEVVATVDTSGNVIVQGTVTQAAPAVPTLPAAINTPQAVVQSVVGIPAVSAVTDAAGAFVSVAAAPVAPVVSAVVAGVGALVPSVPTPPAVAPPAVSANPALPQVPSVPPFPTDPLPVVPSVPPFPSNLNVPSYPWPSGVVSAQAIPVSITPTTASSAHTSGTGSSALHLSISTPYPASNSTISSVQSSVSSTSGASISTSNSLSLTSSQLASLSLSGSSSESLSVSATLSSSTSVSITSASSSFGTATSTQGAPGTQYPGVGGPAKTGASPAQTNAAAGAGATSSSPPLQTPQVVGSVVGSLAGVALILAVLLFLLRRHKLRQRGTLQLTEDDIPQSAVPMTQEMSRNNRIPSAFLHRFSGMSRSTAETSTSGGEPSFQRISGRKLPSAFSEGMTSEQFSRGGTISGSSFYQDDHGTYGGPGLSKEIGKEVGRSPTTPGAGAMSFHPGPARTPIIRHPEDDINPFADPAPFPRATSHLSPPQSPNPDIRRGTLGRSLASADGSRSSKFTENV